MKQTRIRIRGYKCLKDVDLEIRDLMVLVGPNGSGKTSLIEMFTLLRDAAKGELTKSLSDKGGIARVLFLGGSDSLFIELITEPIAPRNVPLVYSLELQRKGIGYDIFCETLFQYRHGPGREPFKYIESINGEVSYFDFEKKGLQHPYHPTWEYKNSETALSQVPRMLNEAEDLRSTFEQISNYGSVDVSKRAPVRLPQELSPIDIPGQNGEAVVSALFNMRSNHPDDYERVQESLRVAFPGFKHLEFKLVGTGQAALCWYQESFNAPLFADQLSEGMLRFLWLSAILLSPTLPSIVLIDEPEVSLHPDCLKILAGLMEEASERAQIVVATHSDVLIRYLKPENVAIVNRDHKEGSAAIKWGDEFELSKWLEKYTLGELWLMGEIG